MASQRQLYGAYVSLVLKTEDFKKGIKDAETETKRFSAGMHEQMQKSREGVRLLNEELGLRLPRGLQNIVSKLPGITTAMNLAFDAVVVFALAKAVYEVGEKIYEFAKKTEEAAAQHKEAWGKITDDLTGYTNGLRVATDKLQMANAEMEHKPYNAMKLAIDEAVVSADTLGKKLHADLNLITEALAKEKVAWYEFGNAGTGDLINRSKDLDAKLQNLKAEEREELKKPENASPARQEEVFKHFFDQRKQAFAYERQGHVGGATDFADHLSSLDQQLKDAEKLQAERERILREVPITALGPPPPMPENQTDRIRQLKSYRESLADEEDAIDAEEDNRLANNQNKVDEAAKKAAENAKKALEALKKDAEDRFKILTDSIAQQKDAYDKQALMQGTSLMDAAGERDLWTKQLYKGTDMGDLINPMIQRKITGMDLSALREQFEQATQWKEMLLKLQEDSDKAFKKTDPFTTGKEFEKTFLAMNEAELSRPELLRQITAAQNELNDSQAVAVGVMEKSTADILAQINNLSTLYAELDELQAQLQAVNSMPRATWTPAMNPSVLGNQILAKQGQIDMAGSSLMFTQSQNRLATTMSTMFNEWIHRATDLKSIMSGVFTSTIDGVNDALLHILTTQAQAGEHPFQQAGKTIATDIARGGLQYAEGSLMSALHIGGKVQKVEIDKAISLSPTTISAIGKAVGASSAVGSAAGGVAASGGGSGMAAAAIQTALSFIPGMAGGGVMSPGDLYLTSEKGPELMTVGSTSRIYSARDTSTLLGSGGGTQHVWHIDARGSTDPAAVRTQIQRGIMLAAPHLVAASNVAAQDSSNRKPRIR